MENTKVMKIKGELEVIVHNYQEKKFQDSTIFIKNKDGILKEKVFYGPVPETLLNKEITLTQSYKKETAELFQCINYFKNKRLKYSIQAHISNIAKDCIQFDE